MTPFMEKQSNVEKLSGYIIFAGIIALIGLACWYFSNVLIYLILAFVVSLVSRPLADLISRARIKGKGLPAWLTAIFSILLVLSGLVLIVTRVIPVIVGIFSEASLFNDMNLMDGSLKDTINGWVFGLYPAVGPDYDAVGVALGYLQNAASGFSLTSILGSVAGAVVDLAVGLFSVVFISFFFVKDAQLFRNIVGALVPDRLEASVKDAIGDIERLLSRYFIGLLLEMLAVAVLNFLGLWHIARIGVNFVLQPLIYSTSIQATPLEIFIVMLMAGHIGGIVGMLAAIPGYTVIRVVAGRFFHDKKIVRRLMPDIAASDGGKE